MGWTEAPIFLAVAALAAACGGSAASPPMATLAPSPPAIVESPASPTPAVLASTVASEPTPEPVVVQQAATATAVPPVQPAVQPAVSTARPPTPGPPSLPAVAIPEAPLRPPPVTVSMTLNLADRSFSPHQVHGNAGDTVALTFTGGTEQHTFTVSSLSIDVTIGARETKQFSFVMPVEGEVPFFCRLHGSPSSGMHGLLIFH